MADLEQVVNDLNLASQSLQELREKYDGALDLLDNKNTEITGALDSAKSDALQEIQTISDTATSQISQLKDTSLNLVNEAKNTAIEEVNNAVSGIDTSKEEALLAIEQAKAAQEEKIADLEQAKESIITELSEKAKLLTQNLTLTVGAGGDFEDLKDAILEALKYKKNEHYIEIIIKTGHIIKKPIVFYKTDLSYIDINSEVVGEEILVSRESAIGSARGFYGFMIFRQCAVSPLINSIFKFDDSPLPSGVTSNNSYMAFSFEGSSLNIYENGGFLSNIGCGVGNTNGSRLVLLRSPRIETSDSTKFAVYTATASITQGSARIGSTTQPYNITRNTISADGSIHLY